jgi:hypothetical protein
VATWQIALTAFALITIVTVFFWGINNQRSETAGDQTAATMPTPATPKGADAQKDQAQAEGQQAGQPAPSTTGQGGGDQKDQPPDNGQSKQTASGRQRRAGATPSQVS